MMLIGDPRDVFFYPILILMMDSYDFAHQIVIFADFTYVRKFNVTYPIPTRGKDKKRTSTRCKIIDVIVILDTSDDFI